MKAKSRYQAMLHTYKSRKVIAGREGRPVMGLTRKINNLQRSIDMLEESQKEIRKIAKLVKEFTNFELWRSSGNRTKKGILAKGLFCKYTIEHKVGRRRGTVPWYLGAPSSAVPSRIRRAFQQSFTTHPENLIAWKKFLQFMSDHYDTTKVDNNNPGLSNRSTSKQRKAGGLLGTRG